MGDYNNFYEDNNTFMQEELKQLDIQKRKESKRILTYSGLCLAIMAIVVLVSQVVIDSFSKRFLPAFYDFDGYTGILSIISFVVIGYPVFIILMKKLPDSEREEKKRISVGKFFGFFLICIAAMYASNFIGSLISGLIASTRGVEAVNPLDDFIFNSNMKITMFYGIIIAPIMEEVIFRKVLLEKLRRFGDRPAILITGFAFGLFHMNLPQFVYASVLGMLFAYITINTNTIKYAIIIHMIVNSIGLGIAPYVLLDPSMLGMSLIFLWVFMSMTIGAVLFIINIKKIKLHKLEQPLVRKRDYIFNPGAMLFLVISVGIIVVGTFIV